MLPRYAAAPHRTGVAAAAAFFIVILFFFVLIVESSNNSQVRCSKRCVAENCNTIGIRYGKYCGVGWTGCPGEKPCDELDACCKIHDECVENNGPFQTCLLSISKLEKIHRFSGGTYHCSKRHLCGASQDSDRNSWLCRRHFFLRRILGKSRFMSFTPQCTPRG